MRHDKETAGKPGRMWVLISLAVGLGLSLLMWATGATAAVSEWMASSIPGAVSAAGSGAAWLWDRAGGFLVFIALVQVVIFGGIAIMRRLR